MAYNYSIPATVETTKHGVGGTVNLRSKASTSGSVVYKINNDEEIYVSTLFGEWLPTAYTAPNGTEYTGFLMAKFVRESDVYGSSSGTSIAGLKILLGFDGGVSNITTGSVNLRDYPSTSGTLKDQFNGTSSTFYTFTGIGTVSEQRQWLAKKYANTYYFACARYIGSPCRQDNSNAKVTATNGVNLRVLPSTSATKICTLANGTYMRVMDIVDDWYRVLTPSGCGWVSSNYVTCY